MSRPEKKNCPQGHEYSADNTYVTPQGYRQCKTCRRERMRSRRPEVGTRASGARGSRGLSNADKTHCPKGHEYTEENTYRNPQGRRWCRTCARSNRLVQNVKRYGISPDQLAEMLVKQDNCCLICRRDFDASYGGKFHLDHDHACCSFAGSCGKCVRGLLCGNCNQGLGRFRDEPQTLRRAADYLERFSISEPSAIAGTIARVIPNT